ncbi:MAG: SDR family NAD(P)-dependent oxidoreductase [Paracoccaceae bacterium]|jgi:NAD(P)-dependent dehydrogenase (short-subunit alcohol dehydrogenase family)|nr:SDR family NAD(P)-dependent oxidoreductase [Paracoccaceae bacterium]MDG2452524.1 SDR family NAD(P)-dependent oxidoreductase [Paracoccaceae bacterium]
MAQPTAVGLGADGTWPVVLSPKTAVVTGAGSGIGRATSLALMDAGWRVALIGRRSAPLHDIANDSAVVIPCDVTDPIVVDAAFAQIADDFGHLDMLFNNAGIFTAGRTIDDIPVDDWLAAVNVNLTGAWLCARAAFKQMRHQSPIGGRIINNGSISAHVPRPGSSPYTATKHAITGLTKSLSLDGRPYNIACGQIDIGNAASDMTAQMSAGILQADLNTRPEPVMDVDHVATSVLHMAELPLDANVQFMTVMASAMPYVGRG